jgi:hypothetical protein
VLCPQCRHSGERERWSRPALRTTDVETQREMILSARFKKTGCVRSYAHRANIRVCWFGCVCLIECVCACRLCVDRSNGNTQSRDRRILGQSAALDRLLCRPSSEQVTDVLVSAYWCVPWDAVHPKLLAEDNLLCACVRRFSFECLHAEGVPSRAVARQAIGVAIHIQWPALSVRPSLTCALSQESVMVAGLKATCLFVGWRLTVWLCVVKRQRQTCNM